MIPYIIHAGLLLAACLVFYKILLQNETFFRLNRWVLMACLVLSFGLPLVEVPQQWSFRKAEMIVSTPAFSYPEKSVPLPETVDISENKTGIVNTNEAIDWIAIVFLAYWAGVIIFLINFLVQIVLLFYRAYTRPVIKDGKFRIVELAGDKAPCSFGNNIFINPEKYDWETYNQILEHEKIHAKEKHTLDLVLAELVIIFQWFNPFAWWYRKELENNLEFLTDAAFLHQPAVEKTSYQLSLLKVSAPHFPLSLTTNYNQSLLKKRVAMMNAKKSNVHTTWKYLFLFPVLVLSVCLLNEPVANAQNPSKKNNSNAKSESGSQSSSSSQSQTNSNNDDDRSGLPTEGYWFATIKGEKVNMQFKSDETDEGTNNTTFNLSDFKNMPREGSGKFTVTRDAGTIEFTGKIEGNQGMGRYKFEEDKSYGDAMRKEGVNLKDERDQLVFFMIDIKKDYPAMLKRNGYSKFNKDNIIPLAALKVDEDFIQSMKKAGFTNIDLEELIPLKAVGVTPEYAAEIRKAGYPNVTAEQLISFKAQKIDAAYIADLRKAGISENKNGNKNGGTSIDNIAAFKSLNIDQEYIGSLAALGYKDLGSEELISMKGVGITPEYIRTWQAAGYKDIPASDLVALKGQEITPEYLRSFASAGFPTVSVHKAMPLKAMGITAEYIKGFRDMGYSDVSLDDVIGLKSQNTTPAMVKEYSDLGFGKVNLHDVVAARATGTTPKFILEMKDKGHNLKSLQKYITLKTVTED